MGILMRRQAYLDRGLTVDGRGDAKVNSLQFKVNSNSNDNVENNRLSGNDGNPAVSAGSAVQPAQPGDSHGADAPHIGDSGGNQDAGGLGAREKNLIAFDLFTQAAGLGGMEIDTVGSRHSSLLAIMPATKALALMPCKRTHSRYCRAIWFSLEPPTGNFITAR